MPARYQIGQEADVEGQGLRFKDGEGIEWAIASDRVKSITVRDVSGEEHEVEGPTGSSSRSRTSKAKD
jgi:hypothetical protein